MTTRFYARKANPTYSTGDYGYYLRSCDDLFSRCHIDERRILEDDEDHIIRRMTERQNDRDRFEELRF